MIKVISYFVSIIGTILLIGCGSSDVVSAGLLQKRKYNKGWHVNRTAPAQQNIAGLKRTELIVEDNQETPMLTSSAGICEESPSNEAITLAIPQPQLTLIPTVLVEECDVVILKSGKETKAKVIEVSGEVVKYRLCGDENGPILSHKSTEVFMIKHANGEKTLMSDFSNDNGVVNDGMTEQEYVKQYYGTNINGKPMNDNAIAGMCVSIGSTFLFFFGIPGYIVGIIFSIKALRQINQDPDHEGGRGMAYAGLAVGIVFFIITVLILVFSVFNFRF